LTPVDVLFSKVERRVVSQLALAHEKSLIEKGSAIRLTVENANRESDLMKPGVGSAESIPPVIKLQVVDRGKLKDLKLENDAARFF
jgi:hypothetical protein